VKVLLYTPIYSGKDYCLKEFMENCDKFNYPDFDHIYVDNSKDKRYLSKLKTLGLEAYHVERGNNTRESLTRSQNCARKIGIDEGYDFILSLESDIFPPKDFIQKLIMSGKQVITGLYMIGDKSKGQRHPCITLKKWNEVLQAFGTRLLTVEEANNLPKEGLMQVEAGGMGCCLIRRNVFTKYPFWYEPRLQGHSDIFFFNDMHNNNIPVWVDLSLFCEHDNKPWSEVEDR